jgi:dephospho-CoA kinase
LLGKDVPADVLESLTGYDTHLDDAIRTVVEEEKGYDEEEEGEDFG